MLTWCLLIQSQRVTSTSKRLRIEQRIVNGKVHMLAKSKSLISAIKVWVFREPEAARLFQDKQGRQELPVTFGNYGNFQVG